MGVTLTDVLLFGKAQLADVDKATLVIYRRNILRWSALGGYLDVIVKGVSPLSLPDAIADSLSYVKAFGGTEQRNLPDNYIERQFIYMMDGSYIKVEDLPISAGYRVEFDFQTTSLSSPLRNYLGGRVGGVAAGGGFRLSKLASGGTTLNRVVLYGFETGTEYYDPTAQFQANTRYKYTYDNGVCTLESGGSVVSTKTFTVTDDTSTEWVINGYINGTYLQSETDGIYVYSLKVWNDQGELVMDLVPAVQRGTVPVVGFYDAVTGGFRTPTAGTFAAGGEAVPTPDAPMDIVSNNGVLKYRDTELPVGYRRILGMTMNNDCYYQTTTYPTGADTLKFSYEWTDVNTACNVLGCYTTSSAQDNLSLYIGNNPSAKYLRYDGGTASSYSLADKRYDVQITPTGSIGMETEATWEQKTFTCSVPLCIGITGAAATSAKFIGNLWGNVELVGVTKFIPCERVSDGEIGYYDTANETFIAPTGTTPTSLGYDYSHYVVVADGTVETINVHGKNLFDQSTATRYRTSWSNGGGGAWQAVSETSQAVCYGCYVKPNTTYTLSKKGGSRLIITGYRTKTEPSSSVTPADYQIQVDTTEIVDGSYTFTTPADCTWILFGLRQNNSTPTFPYDVQLEQGSTASTYEPYYDGGTATTEMLLKVGDYQDVQSIIDGVVTRNIGVKVLDGTENWSSSSTPNIYILNATDSLRASVRIAIPCTHFVGTNATNENMPNNSIKQGSFSTIPNNGGIAIKTSVANNLNDFKTWLAQKYAAGTPVIVLYILATQTTESVAGQTLQVQAGDNILEITQASLNNLALEAQYQASVSLTIQEVQDANLDPNVEVTIN